MQLSLRQVDYDVLLIKEQFYYIEILSQKILFLGIKGLFFYYSSHNGGILHLIIQYAHILGIIIYIVHTTKDMKEKYWRGGGGERGCRGSIDSRTSNTI